MTQSQQDKDREMELKLAQFRFAQEQAKAARPSFFGSLRAARKTVEDATANPGDVAERAVRFGVKALATGAIRGGRAVVQGIADSQKELNGTPDKPAGEKAGAVEEAPATVADWFTQTHARIDARVGKIANSHRSLSMQFMFFGLRQAWKLLNWCGSTYPYILRPVAFASRRMKAGLDRKIEAQQGNASNMQKLRRRLYGIGPRKGYLAAFRYAAINMLTIPIALTLAVDAGYNYGTIREYEGVHISQSNPQSSDNMYEYRVDGYQRLPNGEHDSMSFDIGYSLWHPLAYPRHTADEIQVGKICDFKAYGISAVLASDFKILRAIPDGIRQLVNNYPIILEAHCRPDPDDYRSGPYQQGQQMEPVRGAASATFAPVMGGGVQTPALVH